MLTLPVRADRTVLVGCALALVGLAGWSSFAYSAASARKEISVLQTERDEAVAKYQRLAETSGELGQVEAKLATTRVEYSRAVQGWAEARARIGMAQQELATLTRRVDQARDKVSQTGSIRAPETAKTGEAAKGAARKP